MDEVDREFEALLTYVKEVRGFDFTGYKRSSLMRRVDRRMVQVDATGYADYLDYLQVHQDEFTALFNTILINVTAFFRDPDSWTDLRTGVLEPLVAAKAPHTSIRLWSAGCASGEEAYTLAMLLCEILGPDEFKDRVKIYATDVDEEQLAEARHGSYGPRAVETVPPDLLARYFEPVVGGRYSFRKDLRRSVIFGRNDLVQDAPISRIDLLTCRNTLMYFNAETQGRILSRFHFALVDSGALFLGKAEMLLSHSNLFLPIDLKRRLFRKVPHAVAPLGTPLAELPTVTGRGLLAGVDQLRSAAMLANPVAQIVVAASGLVALTNRQANALFGLTGRHVGRPFQDLEVSYRPIELRKYIGQAQHERRTLHVSDVEYTRAGGDTLFLDVQVNPLIDAEDGLLGVTLIFHDVTAARQLRADLEHANRELEAAYEELQSTNEELETTNEELQSTVEELETTNEELQSTNEELETMNEELQSTNDELQSINEQLHRSGTELDEANAFLDAVLAGLRAGVAVVDRDLKVRVWNREAENLWGLRSAEAVDQHLLNLDIGLPIDQVRPLVRQALTGDADSDELQLDAVNRRGRAITVRVACSPLAGTAEVPSGAIIVMEAGVGQSP
jgi:two-component system, chemotaxis family, CheB/CheR fusion protein